MNVMEKLFLNASKTRDIEEFLTLIFPKKWSGIAARILESGVEISEEMCAWAPKWSKIPPTMRYGITELETAIKSCIFRVHDCIHQLWGLPLPSPEFTEEDFYLYKKSQMCGEVAVLTLTEFVFCYDLSIRYPAIASLLAERNAIPMLLGPLQGKSTLEIALRLDGILHKKIRPKWLREHKESTAFADDYVPMLECDRKDIDHNWGLMRDAKWLPTGAPNARYSKDLDGLELTTWMINDFFHQMNTDSVVDRPLREFNKARRSYIVLPENWHVPKL